MALGLIPAAIVGLLLLSGIVALAVALPGITVAVTPFADGWPSLWATVLRATIGTALVGAAIVLVAISFTALTLIVGEPFYERIWRSVERDLGEAAIDADYGFWRSVGDGLVLFVRGVAIAILAALIGLIPAVGGVLATVFAVLLTGWLIADELSSRALSARGLDHSARRAAHAPPPRARARFRGGHAAVLHDPARRGRDDARRRRRVRRTSPGRSWSLSREPLSPRSNLPKPRSVTATRRCRHPSSACRHHRPGFRRGRSPTRDRAHPDDGCALSAVRAGGVRPRRPARSHSRRR